MSDVSKLRIDPGRAVEGDVVRLVLERPPSSAGLPSVRVGEVSADPVVVCTPHVLLCRVPKGPTGMREVTVHVGEGREIDALGNLEQVEAAERTSPDVSTRLGDARAAERQKPGDPTNPSSNWWMIHQALEHNSFAQDGNVVPLKPLWTRTFSGALMLTQPVLGDQYVLVGIYGNGTEHFAALDPQAGTVIWSRTGTQVSVLATPVAVNGRVYLIEWSHSGAFSSLVCLNQSDGSEVWLQPLSTWSQAGLCAAFGNVYALLRDGTLMARSAEDGALVWSAHVDVGGGEVLSSPAVGFGRVLVGSQGGLKAFDAATGDPRPIDSTSSSNGNASPSIVTDVGVGHPAVVAIGDADGRLQAYNPSSGAQLWTFTGDVGLWWTTPCVANARIYLMQKRSVVALDPVTGSVAASSGDLGAELATGPTAVGAKVVAVLDNDQLVALSASDLSLSDTLSVASHPTGDFGHPTTTGGKLYLNTAASAPWPAAQDTLCAYHRGCIVATAAYGSPCAADVAYLAELRDRRVRPHPLGRRLLDGVEPTYYRVGQPLAGVLQRHASARWMVRSALAPAVRLLRLLTQRG